jgi:preprotein translocase subunit SecE
MEEAKKRAGPIEYLKQSKEELEKVTWPSRKDTVQYAIIVVVVSLLVALFIGALDLGLNLGLDALIKFVS